jgi:enamine deaminase RidA (YjgF/YER057c/UK114 family)
MLTRLKNHGRVRGSVFSTNEGAEEYFLVLNSDKGKSFGEALDIMAEDYAHLEKYYGLSERTLVFGRLYLSDMENQKPLLAGSLLFQSLRRGAISMIEEVPLEGGPISLLCYHVNKAGTGGRDALLDDKGWPREKLFPGNHYSLLWNVNQSDESPLDAYAQTREIFKGLSASIGAQGMSMAANTIRTWVYVRNIDIFYQGMVKARRGFFQENGLTQETRFLASTGIEGGARETGSLVMADALSIKGLLPGQVVRMEAVENMPPTLTYGVTFERGLRVRFGDRSHLYLSGTASITPDGKIMYPGDACRQTGRTLENVEALLGKQGTDLSSLAYLLVYVRNLHDRGAVMERLRSSLPEGVPHAVLLASVCRPGWLVEMEGIAVIPDRTDYPAFL